MIRMKLFRRVRAFARNRKGVAAVEFALILPVMMLFYVGVTELSNGLMASRRVSHSASALGDLITQYTSVQKTDFTNVFAATSMIMAPFNSSTVSLRLTEFTYSSSGKSTVTWTQPSGPGGWSETYTKTQTVTNTSTRDTQVNTLLAQAVANGQSNPSVILSEAMYTYNSPISYALASASLPKVFTFNDAFYLTPRSGATITCSNC